MIGHGLAAIGPVSSLTMHVKGTYCLLSSLQRSSNRLLSEKGETPGGWFQNHPPPLFSLFRKTAILPHTILRRDSITSKSQTQKPGEKKRYANCP